MLLSEDFHTAYAGLLELVENISNNKVPQHVLDDKVGEWEQGDCRGSGTLAEAAVKALRYELAKTGLAKGEEPVSANLRSLGHVEAILQATEIGEIREIREVSLPKQLRQAMPQGRGFRMGELQIIFEPSEGPPYGHLSVSHPRRYPTFDELLGAAGAPGGPIPNLWAWVPKAEDAQNMNPNTVHLFVLPPQEYVG